MDDKRLLEIGNKKRNKDITDSWDELAKKSGRFSSGEEFRLWVKNQAARKTPKVGFKEAVEIHADRSQSSNKLIRMSADDMKDSDYLLQAHGYDKDKWILISARSNIWNAYSKKDGVMQLYASKITVKPKDGPAFAELIDTIKDIRPVKLEFKPIESADKGLLEIPLFDAHFGVSDYEYYKQTQERIADKLSSWKWEEVLFVVGQDCFHNDSFRGQTSSGTPIETVDMSKAWKDASDFYCQLIELSLRQSKRVKIIYSKGNHDEAMSWAFVQYLKATYPQVTYDDAMVERKAHVFGANFIGITHGDKARKNLHNLFPVEFPLEWSVAKNREIHTGHFHIEDGKDVFGMMVRTLSTRNKTDKWHKDNGFVGGHKRFMLFEYSEEELECIHYV